jgi:hypothetical protein
MSFKKRGGAGKKQRESVPEEEPWVLEVQRIMRGRTQGDLRAANII